MIFLFSLSAVFYVFSAIAILMKASDLHAIVFFLAGSSLTFIALLQWVTHA